MDATPGGRSEGLKIAFVWQRYLPYHQARLLRLERECSQRGLRLHPVEVASDDVSYGFPAEERRLERRTCFPGSSYHRHTAEEVFKAVSRVLRDLEPDVVFAPATPFPEGMAAIAYRNSSRARVFMMDDAWEWTDRTGSATRLVKRLIHGCVDGAFIPGPSHRAHFESLGFPPDRIVYGVDAVDNERHADLADRARSRAAGLRAELSLPERYFLYVGRFIDVKGLDDLLRAFTAYRANASPALDLLLVGGTEAELPAGCRLPRGAWAIGRRYGDDLGAVYGLADALVFPSKCDTWGLVVNEAMASGLPVLVSRGCGAAALIQGGVNGWTFEPGDVPGLTRLLTAFSELPPEDRSNLGHRSREIVSEWGLDRFVEGVFRALRIPRVPPPGPLALLAARLWRGRIRVL